MVTGGSSLHAAYQLFGGTKSFGLSAWIVVFAATELLSCQVIISKIMPQTPYTLVTVHSQMDAGHHAAVVVCGSSLLVESCVILTDSPWFISS